jgi:diguanylate cyclase (GGDEF)-like protein
MISPIQHWLGRTLTRKFTLLLAGFMALQALQLGVGISGILHISEEAAGLVNEAGRQRYRTLLLGTLARQALADGAWTVERREQFTAVRKEYELYFAEFQRLAAQVRTSPQFQPLLAEARASWEKELLPLLAEFDLARPDRARAALRRYEALAPGQVARLDRIVSLIERDVEEDIHQLAGIQAVLLGLSLLLGIAGLIMARFMVARPLRHLIEVTEAIAGGAYQRRVALSSRDELGTLAGTFNRMAEVVGAKTARVTAFNRAAGSITSSLSVREILDQIMYHGIDVSGAKAACLAFYDEPTGRFKDWVTQGLSDHFVQNMSFRPGGLADETFVSGTHVFSNDLPGTKHQLSKLARDEGIRSFICLPLTSHAGRLGVIYFYRGDRDTFLPDEIDLLQTFAHLAAGALENARLYARVEQEARIDTLTGLLNRRVFDRRLEDEQRRAQRYGKPYTLLMFDIDHFKRINDSYGHPAGDAVLRALAGILTKQFREVDTVARYGGEEFVAILPEVSASTARPVAERVRRAIASAPFRLPDGREIGITVSIGVSCYPHCGASAREVVERADQAMYTAKEAGRNRVVLYREMLKKQIDADPGRIVALLNESLDNIQPIVTAISAKTPFFRGHMQAVEQATLRLARALQLSAEDTEALKLASRLHDIGMAMIPDAILDKTNKLTAQEWAQVRRHSAIAADWLDQVPALKHLAPLVRHHHERFDGGGYPDGLKGEATPYLARVLAVADAYGSMTSDWLGHKGMKPEEARAALRAGAGTQFDPAIAQAWLRTLEETPAQA